MFGAAIRRSVDQNNKIFGLFWGALEGPDGPQNPPQAFTDVFGVCLMMPSTIYILIFKNRRFFLTCRKIAKLAILAKKGQMF